MSPCLSDQPVAEAQHGRPRFSVFQQQEVLRRTAQDVRERLDELSFIQLRSKQDRRQQGHARSLHGGSGVQLVSRIVVGIEPQRRRRDTGLSEPARPIVIGQERQRSQVRRR